jgi:hypothetical protein
MACRPAVPGENQGAGPPTPPPCRRTPAPAPGPAPRALPQPKHLALLFPRVCYRMGGRDGSSLAYRMLSCQEIHEQLCCGSLESGSCLVLASLHCPAGQRCTGCMLTGSRGRPRKRSPRARRKRPSYPNQRPATAQAVPDLGAQMAGQPLCHPIRAARRARGRAGRPTRHEREDSTLPLDWDWPA